MQAKAARLRKAQRDRERRRRLLAVVAAVVVVLLVVGGVAYAVSRHHSATDRTGASAQIVPATPTGSTTVQKTPARVPDSSGISGVLAWNTAGYPGPGTASAGTLTHDHVPGPVTYAVVPPVGGPHNAIWINVGVYTKPIPNERAVHNLEHGAVWITYDPNLPAAQVAKLAAFVDRQSYISESSAGVAGQANRFIDLSPWATSSLPSPIVISAWGHQLRVTSPSDPRLQQFVDTLRHSQRYTPEYGAIVDGIPIQTGGRAARDGGKRPNSAGTAG